MSSSTQTQPSFRNLRLALPLVLILVGMFTRLIPHPPNFTAIGAVALFAGARLQPRSLGVLVPLLAMFLTDLILGLHSGMLWVYVSLLPLCVMGFATPLYQAAKVLGMGVLGSVVFYLLSNFGVWMGSPAYSADYAGLLACYIAGLPFLGSFVAATAFYSVLIFGADRVLTTRGKLSQDMA
ncbi:hypothetical protein GC167_00395 [bacterium]|nr:hypothetical protein [bacterium]